MPEPMPDPAERKGFTVDRTLTLIVAVIGIYLGIHPPQTPLGMGLGLALMFAFAVVPALHAVTWLLGKCQTTDDYGNPIHILALLILVSIIAFIGHGIWPPIRRHQLDDKDRAKFEKPLKDQTRDRFTVILSCPSDDEQVCVYGAQYINIFREAGWTVQNNQIERATLGVPYNGIRLFSYVPNYPKSDAPVNSGVWTKITPSLISVYSAFSAIGIEADSGIRNDVPENFLTVYFGPEKDDESQPTDMTRTYGNMKAFAKSWPTSTPQKQ